MNLRPTEMLLQSAATATGDGTTLPVASYDMAVLQISGTFSATVTWEATLDGSTWFTWFAFNYAGTRGATATATGVYMTPCRGFFGLRARISAYTSGSVTVRGRAMSGALDAYQFGQQEATLDGDQIDIDWNPTYYTPDTTPAEADDADDLSAHLYGIDQALAARVKADGSVPLTADWDIGDGLYIATDKIRARDSAGLQLHDDDGNGLFVEDGGQVGIGQPSPSSLLHVGDTGGDSGIITVESNAGRIGEFAADDSGALVRIGTKSSHNFQIIRGGTNVISIAAAAFYPSTDNTYGCGQSGNRWTSVWATNGTIQTSDVRDKQNIEACDRGIEFIKRINPIKYRWRNGDGREHYGLSAQQVKQATEADGKGDFGGYVYDPQTDAHGLNYAAFIGPLVQAIKEQQATIESLTSRLAALEGLRP